MIDIFESTAQLRPEAVFFTAVDRRGNETAYTYRQARLIASQLARRLRDKGVFPGDVVAVDLPNDPMYVFLALAAAYGGFALVALNHRLTDAEKLTRVLELERAGLRVAYTVDAAGEPKLFEAVCNSLLRNERAGRRLPRRLSRGRHPLRRTSRPCLRFQPSGPHYVHLRHDGQAQGRRAHLGQPRGGVEGIEPGAFRARPGARSVAGGAAVFPRGRLPSARAQRLQPLALAHLRALRRGGGAA